MGWLVVPTPLLNAVRREKLLADRGSARIDQLAFAHFLERGELDRHLRRMRTRYRARRDAIVETLATELPDATVHGIAAGLHATVELPEGTDEAAVLEAAEQRRIRVESIAAYRLGAAPPGPPTLLLGYSAMPEPSLRAGVRELAAAIRAAGPDLQSGR